jgi:hypothetical protein
MSGGYPWPYDGWVDVEPIETPKQRQDRLERVQQEQRHRERLASNDAIAQHLRRIGDELERCGNSLARLEDRLAKLAPGGEGSDER